MGRRRKKKGLMRFMTIPRMPELDLDPETKKSIFIVVLLALGAISMLGIFNLAGGLGSSLKDFLTWAFGQARLLYASLLLAWAFYLYSDRYELRGGNWLGLFLFTMSLQAILSLFVPMDQWEQALKLGSGGGQVGMFLAGVFVNLMGLIASILLTLSLLVISFLLLFNTTLNRLFGRESLIGKILYPVNWLINKIFNRHKEDDPSAGSGQGDEDDESEEEEEDEEEETDEEESEEENEEEEESEEESASSADADAEDDEEHDEEREDDEEEDEVELPEFMKKADVEEDSDPWWMEKNNDEFRVPLTLLNDKKEKPTSGDIEENKEIIKNTLEQFKLSVDMGAVCVGPTVTQYTFKPARGVKLSKVTTLSNDLALALAAHPIRIEAPIPGKSLVGIEVPNKTKAMVSLKEILSSKSYKERKHNMMVALGKDVAGNNWLDDVTKMPHLLVAGATNSGKSVCLNTIIVSLLYQNTSDDLRFIMVDPKRVELPGYNGLPHLLCPVITDVKQTVSALNWCLREMESRFIFLSREGHRNIQSYNENTEVKMPYIVFIIDELADLMVTASKEIETAVIRLAQMSRAVGIHLILATQRPSVNVITGLIKANMPARIAFSVASGQDSRTILDSMGAEKLLGQGDMLVINAQVSKPLRLQGAYLSDAEIKKVVKYIKQKSSKPNFITGVLEQANSGGGGSMMSGDGGGSGGDDKFEEAKEMVINSGKASASLLQRRMSIGYSRAARLIDLLEENGIVGPANGAKAREILVTKEQYEAVSHTAISGVSVHRRDEARVPKSFLGEDTSTNSAQRADEEIGGAPIFKSSKVNEDPSTSSGQGDDDEDEEEEDDEDVEDESASSADANAEDEEENDDEGEEESEEENEEEGEEEDPSTGSGQGDEEESEDEDDENIEKSDDLEEDNGKYFSK